MNTLDEVIIGIREQIGLGDPILIDALYYLKAYKEKGEEWLAEEKRMRAIIEACNKCQRGKNENAR